MSGWALSSGEAVSIDAALMSNAAPKSSGEPLVARGAGAL